MRLFKRQLLILLILANISVLGQSRSFQLSFTEGSVSLDQYLFIQQSGKNSKITLVFFDKSSLTQEVFSGRISRKDCDDLWLMLENYKFNHESEETTSALYDSVLCSAIELPDSLRIVLGVDTIRKELLSWFDYFYNPKTKNYYKLKRITISKAFIDDGKHASIAYRNEEVLKEKRFSALLIITDQDKTLTSFLIYLLKKYKSYCNKEYLNYLIQEINAIVK